MSARMEAGPIQGDLSHQATAWLVRLDDEPENEALRLAFMDWLTSSPAHLAAWEETTRISLLMTAVGPLPRKRPVISASWARPRLFGKGRTGRTLASISIGTALAWAIVPDLAIQLRADEMTETGEARLVSLEDGSAVHLAPDTAIAFTSDAQGRTLELLRGEAWFDVASDRTRPFRVETGISTVTVLGTAFSVRRSDEGTDVAVQRGRVAVTAPGGAGAARVELVAGQSLSVSEAGEAMRGEIRIDRVATWREGVAIVNDQPITEVIDRIRPWYKGYIVVRGAGMKDRRVSGIYDLRDPDLALEALTRVHDVTVSSASPWVRIVTIG